MPKLTIEQKKEVINLFENKELSFGKIAKKYNVTKQSIAAMYKRTYGKSTFAAPSPSDQEERRLKIYSDIKTGKYTLSEIATKYSISRQRVHELAKRIFPDGYKLNREKNKAEKEALQPAPIFNCRMCGKFVGRGEHKTKYCDECSDFSKNHKKAKVRCEVCSKYFYPIRDSFAKYCSRDCYFISRWASKKKIIKAIK